MYVRKSEYILSRFGDLLTNTLEDKKESCVHKTLFHRMQCKHSKYKIYFMYLSIMYVYLNNLEKLHKVMVENILFPFSVEKKEKKKGKRKVKIKLKKGKSALAFFQFTFRFQFSIILSLHLYIIIYYSKFHT